MNNNIEEQLSSIEPKSLTEGEKHWMWNAIERGIETPAPVSTPKRFFASPLRFWLQVGFAAVIVFAGSAVITKAADDAHPGDALFELDVFAERIQLIFTPDGKKAELRISFATERLDEVKEALGLDVITTMKEPPVLLGSEAEHEVVTQRALEELVRLRSATVRQGQKEGVAPIDEKIGQLIFLTKDYNIPLSGVDNSEDNTEEEIEIKTQTSEVVKITPIRTHGWASYENEAFGFSLKYPVSWKVTEWTDGAGSHFRLFHVTFLSKEGEDRVRLDFFSKKDAEYKQSLSHPGAWETVVGDAFVVVYYDSYKYLTETKQIFKGIVDSFVVHETTGAGITNHESENRGQDDSYDLNQLPASDFEIIADIEEE